MARNHSPSEFASSAAIVALSILFFGPGATAQQVEDLPARPAALTRLEPLAGDWQGAAAIRATQWTPGSISPLTATFRWILSGRHLEGTLRYAVGGKPFESRILISYDTNARLYKAHWLDNFSSEAITFSGILAEERTLNLSATRKQNSQVVTERLRIALLKSGDWELASSSNAAGDMTELVKLTAQRRK
jgi:hypothetical protein